MCVHPNTSAYEETVVELSDLTRTIANGHATAPVWLNRGELLRLIGEIPGAIRDYDRALARPDELSTEQLALIHCLRGTCYRRTYRYADSIADIHRALALEPNNGFFWSCLGTTRYYAGEIEQAVLDLTRAIELDPSLERAWQYRALCHQALGHFEQALSDATDGLTVNIAPEPLTFTQRAYSYLMLGQYASVIADCDRAEKRDAHGETFEIYRLRGIARVALGEFAPALTDFSRALSLRPAFAESYLWRGLVYRALGDPMAAADEFTEFVKLHPDGALTAFKDMSAFLQCDLNAPHTLVAFITQNTSPARMQDIPVPENAVSVH